MTALETSLRRILGALASRQIRAALVGGLAVSIRAEPRFTRDADLVVALSSDAEAEALVAGLATEGYRVVAAIEHERLQRLATVRLTGGRQVDGIVVRQDLEGVGPVDDLRLDATRREQQV